MALKKKKQGNENCFIKTSLKSIGKHKMSVSAAEVLFCIDIINDKFKIIFMNIESS